MQLVHQDLLFDVEEITTVNSRLAAEKEGAKRTEFYKNAELPCYENPQTDNELLCNFQFRWLKNNDIKAREELYKLSYKVLFRLLWAEMKKGKMSYLDEEQQSDIVADAFVYVFRRYSKGGGYYVTDNFISVLRFGIRHALQYRTMADEERSLDSLKKDWTNKVVRVF